MKLNTPSLTKLSWIFLLLQVSAAGIAASLFILMAIKYLEPKVPDFWFNPGSPAAKTYSTCTIHLGPVSKFHCDGPFIFLRGSHKIFGAWPWNPDHKMPLGALTSPDSSCVLFKCVTFSAQLAKKHAHRVMSGRKKYIHTELYWKNSIHYEIASMNISQKFRI